MTFCVGTKSGIEPLLSYEYDRLFVLQYQSTAPSGGANWLSIETHAFDSATCTRPGPPEHSHNTFTLPNWRKIAALLSFSISQENPLLGLKIDFSAINYLDGLLTSINDCNNQIVPHPCELVPLKTTGNGLCLVRIYSSYVISN